MLNQNQNTVNPSRDLFVLNKSVNKIRSFNAAIPSDFSTVSKADAARIKKEALELVNLISYALNQRALKIDVLDDEKKRIESTKHTSIVYYSLNLIAAQLETTARGIAEKLEKEPTTETETTEPTTTTETTTTETTEPGTVLELVSISDAVKKDIRDFIARFQTIGRARKDVFGRLYRTLDELRRFCRANHIRRAVFVDRPFKPSKIHLIASDWENMQDISADKIDDPRDYSRRIAKLLENTLTTHYNHVFTVIKSAPVAVQEPAPLPTVKPKQEETPADYAPVVVEETPAEAVEHETVEEIDDDDETGDEETTEEKERALELVATSTVERLRAGVVAWRHLKSDMKTAPRSWDRLRPYSLNNTLIIESTPETSGARLLITLDRADVKEDGESVIDWTQYDNAGADVWQPRKFKLIPLKDEHGELIKDDDGKILATRKVSKYGKVTIHDADLFPWLEKKRAQKYAQLERIIASEIKERDAKRAALLGAAPEKWADNLAQIVKRFFDGTKLTQERAALGQEIARAFIASRLGFDLEWDAAAEKTDAARLLALCVQGDKKHETTGHALQVVLKHVNKCVASILYQSQPTAIKPRAEKPAPVATVEEVETENTLDGRNYDAEEIQDVIETLEHLAIVADTMDGRDVEANDRRDAQEKTARKLIEEARENETVNASQLDSYKKDIDRINTEYPPTRIEDGLIIRRNPDGSESWLSNGVEVMRDVTNAN